MSWKRRRARNCLGCKLRSTSVPKIQLDWRNKEGFVEKNVSLLLSRMGYLIKLWYNFVLISQNKVVFVHRYQFNKNNWFLCNSLSNVIFRLHRVFKWICVFSLNFLQFILLLTLILPKWAFLARPSVLADIFKLFVCSSLRPILRAFAGKEKKIQGKNREYLEDLSSLFRNPNLP